MHANQHRTDYWFLGATGALALGLALLLSWPWLPRPVWANIWAGQSVFTPRERFLPRYHGQAVLYVDLDADGAALNWVAENVVRVPVLPALTGALPGAIYDTMLATWPEINATGQLPPGAAIFRIQAHTYTPQPDGAAASIWLDHYLLRTTTGDYHLGLADPNTGQVLAYTPPLRQAIPNLSPPQNWSESGQLGGAYAYTMTGAIHASPAISPGRQNDGRFPANLSALYSNAAGSQSCRLATLETRLALPSTAPLQEQSVSWLCSGLGPTIGYYIAGDAGPEGGRTRMLLDARLIGEQDVAASDDVPLYSRDKFAAWMPPPTPLEASASDTDTMPTPVETWTLQYMGSNDAPGGWRQSTVPPSYVPAAQPYVLVAGQSGSLVALDARTPELVRWRFRMGGATYGPPAVAVETGSLFLGGSDKRVYALNQAGLFLWSAAMHDNVAASPLYWDGKVFVLSEDGSAYALTAQHGAPLWKTELDAGGVAAPLLYPAARAGASRRDASPRLILATDAGSIYALNPAAGDTYWHTELDAAVAAAPLAHEDRLFVVTRTGELSALSSSSGAILWQASLNSKTIMSPVIDDDHLYIIDQNGGLHAIRQRDGRIQWQSYKAWYVGSPLLVHAREDSPSHESMLAVATAYGEIRLLSDEGALLQSWPLATVAPENDAAPTLTYGPILGGAAIWVVDDTGRLYRLGSRLP